MVRRRCGKNWLPKTIDVVLAVCLAAVVALPGSAPGRVPVDASRDPRGAQWFRSAKYGMFIHWGLYAVPAGHYQGNPVPGLGEWIMRTARIPIPEYEQYASQFNPVRFDARQWVHLAKTAGMKYLVVTAKHHDGFSIFDTAINDYNIVDATPFKRDPIGELARAAKAAGIKFGVYYSIMDWHHRDANKEHASRYITQMKEQLRELVVKYDPAILWFDGEWVDWWDRAKGQDVERFLRELKPDVLINNRVGKRTVHDGDFETPEQEVPSGHLGRLWETSMTLNDTWGFKRDDDNWKSAGIVVRKLAEIAGKGGGLLLNVGPTAEGEIPQPAVEVLAEVGRWLRRNGEAIYGTVHVFRTPPAWGSVTRRDNHLYAIVFAWPEVGRPLRLPLKARVKKARLLRGGAVRVRSSADGIELLLPPRPQEERESASVVKLEFEGRLATTTTPAAAGNARRTASVK